MSKKRIPNDKSESWIITVSQKGKKDRYYMSQIIYSSTEYMKKWEVDKKGYYLFVMAVDYNPIKKEILGHNILFSDIKLLVASERRNEKKFNLAVDMIEKSSKEVIDELEKERDLLDKKGVTDEEINEFLNIFKESYEKDMKEKKTGMRYEEKKEEKKNNNEEKTMFKDVAGMDDIKETLLDVIDQFNNPERYEYFDIKPIKSLLLYGQPGTGKTFIANAFANESNAKFIKVSLGEIGSKYQNETGNNIKKIFDNARMERGKVILYLDEIDSIACKRGDSSNDKEKNNTLNVLLCEMSSEENDNIFILCATNFYELLDPAFVRAGRIDVKIEVPLPDFETRLQILKLNTKKKPLGEDVNLEEVSERLEGKNCADVSLLCNTSARIALKKDKMEINQEDFEEAINKMSNKKKEERQKVIGFVK
jgi:SpoVK/Ycf46/Vps4 family AAA+-type ATPase